MYKLKKIIDNFLNKEIEKIMNKNKEELEEHQLQLRLAIEELNRKKVIK